MDCGILCDRGAYETGECMGFGVYLSPLVSIESTRRTRAVARINDEHKLKSPSEETDVFQIQEDIQDIQQISSQPNWFEGVNVR